MNANVGYFVDI